MLVNHANSGLPVLNATVADGVIQERLRTAMASLVGVVTRLSESHFRSGPIVVLHGYDYPRPGRARLARRGLDPARAVARARVPRARDTPQIGRSNRNRRARERERAAASFAT